MGLLFLIAAIRDILPFEPYLEWMLFITLFIGMVVSLLVKARWFAFYYYILLIFYNPLFLVFHNIQNSYIADVGIGVSFFMIGLHWEKYVGNEF